MSKKKIVLLIVILLLAMVLLFMANTFRKFMIVKDLQNKIAMKVQDPNFYRKAVTTGENSEVVTEGYRKGDKKFVTIKRTMNGEEMKISLYDNGTTINVYTETSGKKTVKPNGSSELIFDLANRLETFNDWQTFINCIKAEISTTTYDGKECYIIKNFEEPNMNEETELYIEKETGLCLKSTIMNQTSVIEYEFYNVTDEIFTEPDMSLYELVTE